MTLSSLISNRHPSTETPTEEIENTIDASTLCTDNIGVSAKNAEMHKKSIFFNILSQVKKCVSVIRSSWSSLTFRILIVIFACVISPFPSWITGFLIGSILSGFSVYWLFKPGRPKEPFFLPSYSQILSNIPITEVTDEPIIYKGWMNQLPYDINYNPDTYHVNCTRSLYVRLDGSYLRISFPQSNIPKRAMFNEPHHDKQFIHQQHYDITGASVELLPKGLARKRLWSKKYPICLRISNPKQAVLSNVAKDITDDSVSTKSGNRKENPQKKFVPRINENNEVVMYLFARTDRDKDLWYNRFKMASKIKMLKSHSPSSSPNIAAMDSSSLESKRTISVDLASLQLCSNYDSADIDNKESDEIDSFTDISITKQQKFELYMSHLLAPMHVDHSLIFPSLTKEKKEISDCRLSKSNSLAQGSLMWLNVLIGRIFYDFLTEDIWARVVTERIQRKLSKIKLPVFLNELTVKDINLGTALPKIHRASEPSVDQRGLWIDIDISYNGSFQMTLETKLNLLRHKTDSDDLSLSDMDKDSETSEQPLRSPVYNSEEEDSAESSSDEDLPMPDVQDGSAEDSTSQAAGGSTGKKLLRFVDRLAQSTYFQQAAKNKYIKKAMEDISNTPLVLTVEVQWLTGTLALNIPPMPTDRLWYGFRTNPYLSIVARPKLGQHVVTFTHVTDWIERKLVSEFQKVLVMPNMDDLIIPIMQMD
ncbi:Testis-expressed sequence 2 protein, partial [Stegodyphus mimosarum]